MGRVPTGKWKTSAVRFVRSSFDTVRLCILGTRTATSLLRESSDEGAINNHASGWLLLIKLISLGPQPGASASPRVTGEGFLGFEILIQKTSSVYFEESKNICKNTP